MENQGDSRAKQVIQASSGQVSGLGFYKGFFHYPSSGTWTRHASLAWSRTEPRWGSLAHLAMKGSLNPGETQSEILKRKHLNT